MFPPGGGYSSGYGSGFPDYGSNLYGSYGSHGSQGSQGSQTNELGWTPAYGAKYGNVWPSNDTCVFNQTASDLASTQWLPMQGGRDSLCTNGTEYLFGSQHIWCRCNPGFRGGGLVRQNCDPEFCASPMCMQKVDISQKWYSYWDRDPAPQGVKRGRLGECPTYSLSLVNETLL